MNEIKLSEVMQKIDSFCTERDWDQYHTPKDLAIGAVTEASELLELFRFQSNAEVDELMQDEEFRIAVGDELADVLFFVARFSSHYGFDLAAHFERKMQKNAAKDPVGTR